MKKPEAVVFDLGKVLLDFDYTRFANNALTQAKEISTAEMGKVTQGFSIPGLA